MGWLRDKTQGTAIDNDYITKTLDSVWKSQLIDKGLADYIVLYLTK